MWVTEYLKDKKQRVFVPGGSSRWTSIKAGVHQGSILYFLFFLICTNRIIQRIDSSIRLYADDTSLYIVSKNPILSFILLNPDFSEIN